MTGLLPVLRCAASGRKDLDPTLLDEPTIQWAVRAGLAPLLCHFIASRPDLVLPDALRSADMVAQISVNETLDALEEILSGCGDLAQEVALLKGVSICQRLYPKPHLRPMGDIDLWIPEPRAALLESLLSRLGYRQQSNRPVEFYRTHHHSMPYFHPSRHVWVEVHTALLSNRNVASEPVFSPMHIKAQWVPTVFRGYKTHRLNPELEIIYLATHWALERKCFIGGALPLVDMLYLIQNEGNTLDWDRILSAIQGSPSAIHVCLMLGFLHKHRLISLPAGILERLNATPRYPLAWSEAILHRLIDRYSMEGKPFGRMTTQANLGIVWETLLTARPGWRNMIQLPFDILIPADEPRRYSLAFQFTRLMRGLGIK